MSRSYYYFAASLPTLQLDGEPPMSVEEFLKDCERLLHEEDFFYMQKLLSKSVTDYVYIQRIQADKFKDLSRASETFKTCLKARRTFLNEIAYFRAERAGKDPNRYIRGERSVTPWMQQVIQEADKADNLLEGEKILDRARWNFLEDLERGHAFDFDYLVIYGMKLLVLERSKEIRAGKGKAVFEQIKELNIP